MRNKAGKLQIRNRNGALAMCQRDQGPGNMRRKPLSPDNQRVPCRPIEPDPPPCPLGKHRMRQCRMGWWEPAPGVVLVGRPGSQQGL